MTDTILAAIIGGIFALLAVLLKHYLENKSKSTPSFSRDIYLPPKPIIRKKIRNPKPIKQNRGEYRFNWKEFFLGLGCIFFGSITYFIMLENWGDSNWLFLPAFFAILGIGGIITGFVGK